MTRMIWLPESARAPRFACANCDEHPEFDNEDRYIRHVAKCVKRNPPEPPPDNMVTGYLDKEQMAWVNKRKAEGKPLKGILGARFHKR